MTTRNFWTGAAAALSLLLLVACSSSDELNGADKAQKDEPGTFERVDREEPIIPETDEPVEIEVVEDEDAPASEKPVPMHTRDEPSHEPAEPTPPQVNPPPQQNDAPSVAPRAGSMMWSVQLGAFKNESGAFELVDELKKKFNHPVYKRYDPATGYYKVTMGSFQDREQAAQFKLDIQSRGYPDAFTVEVAR